MSVFLQIDISKCHYLVDLDTAAETPREPRYSANKDDWVTIAYKPFLDASRYALHIWEGGRKTGKSVN